MTLNTDDLLNSILASFDRISNIKTEDLPNIDLYMDQVTSLMEKKLKSAIRNPEDKILTKTMINNYAKNDLIPPPEKKKYTKEHIVLLIFIFYSKGFLSITDVQTMLSPLTDRYFGGEGKFDLCDIYDEVFSMEEERTKELKDDVTKKFERAMQTFQDAPKDDQEVLQMFSFIFMLGYDVYTKKLLIEKLLDGFGTRYQELDNKKQDKNKKEKKEAQKKESVKSTAAKAENGKKESTK
ncbi:MAG: DUF1836 domain-containing protein [Lachnospiraceae bacterium]|nr:DUF1836 domain-containing protein [Lachnospiraceae bacterium]